MHFYFLKLSFDFVIWGINLRENNRKKDLCIEMFTKCDYKSEKLETIEIPTIGE